MIRLPALIVLALLAGCVEQPAPPAQYAVFFLTNTTELTPDGRQVMDRIITTARQAKPEKIMVEGHADGGTAADATLANQRARTVLQALVGAGFAADRVEINPNAAPPGTTGVAAHKVLVRFLP